MNHEFKRAPRDVPYLPAGSGMAMTRLCFTCGKPKQHAGGKVIRLMWHCATCLNAKGKS